MPSPPYALVRASLNGGAIQTGGISAAGGEVVQLSADPAGLNGATQYLWELLSFPSAFTVPAGWSTNARSKYTYSGQTPPPFTLRLAAEFGKYIIRLTLNGGGPTITSRTTVAEATAIAALVDVATAIDVPSSSGLHDLGFYEGMQFSGDGWVEHHRDNLRLLNNGVGATDAATLAAAETYASSGDATTLASSHTYADTGDATTLAAAKTYADAALYPPITTSSSASYTPVLADAYIILTNAAPTLVIPTNASVAYPIGKILIAIGTAAQITVNDASVTIPTGGKPVDCNKKSRLQGSSISLKKVATDTWHLAGDLEPTP